MGIATAIRQLLPASEPREHAPLGRQGLDIKGARKALAAAIDERNRSRAEVAQACERLAHVEGHASACAAELEAAEKHAQESNDAAYAFQREHLARGEAPPQSEAQRLAQEAAEATRCLAVARESAATADDAARDVLPGLQEKEADTQRALERLDERVGELSRAVVRAELDRRMADIYPALDRVREFYALAVTVDKAAGIKLSQEDIPQIRCWFRQSQLERAFRNHSGDKWREWAQQLREDADAQL